MAEFIEMQQHLKEKEDLVGALQAQLEQTQAEQAAQVFTEETVASLQKRVVELENEKGAFHLSPREVEELKVESEKLSSQITLMEAQNITGEAEREVSQLKELKNLQQQYLQMTQEITELRPLKAQLQEYKEKTKTFQIMQEKCRQEKLAWQQELHQLRMEKNSWQVHERRMKEQYLMAISDKDQQLSHLQNPIREQRTSSSETQSLTVQYQSQASPEIPTSLDGSQNLVYEVELVKTQLNDSLKEMHQKELRIQQLNDKFSQLLEEKNTLSTQLSDTSQSLCENQQHYRDLLNHCAVLEKQVQGLQAGSVTIEVTPGAPQEKNGTQRKNVPEELRQLQLSFSEAQQQLCNTKQEVSELRKLLEEEQGQRMAVRALSVAEEHTRRWRHREWDSVRTPIIGACGTQEQAVVIDIPDISCPRTEVFQDGSGSFVRSAIPGTECHCSQPFTFSWFMSCSFCASQAIYKLC